MTVKTDVNFNIYCIYVLIFRNILILQTIQNRCYRLRIVQNTYNYLRMNCICLSSLAIGNRFYVVFLNYYCCYYYLPRLLRFKTRRIDADQITTFVHLSGSREFA